MLRALGVVIVLSCGVGALAACSPRDAPLADVVMVNQARTSRGVGLLRWDSDLARKAGDWARYLASQGRLAHSDLAAGVPAGWSTLGENVGVGRDVGDVHRQFMGSTPHRAAILASRFDHIGVGVATSGGQVWVVEVFSG